MSYMSLEITAVLLKSQYGDVLALNCVCCTVFSLSAGTQTSCVRTLCLYKAGSSKEVGMLNDRLRVTYSIFFVDIFIFAFPFLYCACAFFFFAVFINVVCHIWVALSTCQFAAHGRKKQQVTKFASPRVMALFICRSEKYVWFSMKELLMSTSDPQCCVSQRKRVLCEWYRVMYIALVLIMDLSAPDLWINNVD